MLMERKQGYKFRLSPKSHHLPHLTQSLGANRVVWNKLLAMNLYRLENKLPLIWYNEMAWFIRLWKETDELSFLKQAPSQSLQQTAKALDRAFRDAFDKTQVNKRLPVKKRLGKNEAGIRYPQGIELDEKNQVIRLPKLGWVKYRMSRQVKGLIKNVTVTRKAGYYYLSIQTQQEVGAPCHPAKSIVGIDVGVKRFATLSTGEVIEPIHSYRVNEAQLVKAQQILKHKTKFSQNWKKQQLQVAKLHMKIAHVRSDFLHKATTAISKNHALVVLEDLRIVNMSKSASGSIEKPGRMVKQKSGLNKSLLDQGFGEFRRQLEYKQVWLGGWVVTVPPHYTSQTCPACTHVSKENRRTQAEFACVSCDYVNHADLVGAINILRAGHAQLACEVSVDVSHASSRNQLSTVL
ncbi:MAG: transposase, partial [Gammaproteobacteria bacterium]|nr:transposase [Gammaproteobacteria bacterium]